MRRLLGAGAAGGKVILAGEHAVVHGQPAVVVGVAARTEARIYAHDGGASRIRVASFGIDVAEGDDHDLARALAALRRTSPASARPVLIEVSTTLPPGAGMGSSASLGVAVARALDPGAATDTVVERAMAWERVFHGNPSGIDVQAAARGGCLWFQRGRVPQRLPFPDGAHLCIGHSGEGARTRDMVAKVEALRATRPHQTELALRHLGAIARGVRDALLAQDLGALGARLDDAHATLSALGVSTPALDELCVTARAAGALGAKLTGSGGGGCAVALAGSFAAADAVCQAWREDGFEGFALPLEAPAAAIAQPMRRCA